MDSLGTRIGATAFIPVSAYRGKDLSLPDGPKEGEDDAGAGDYLGRPWLQISHSSGSPRKNLVPTWYT